MSFVPLPSFRPESVNGVVYNNPSVWETALARGMGSAVGGVLEQFVDDAIVTGEEQAAMDLSNARKDAMLAGINRADQEAAYKGWLQLADRQRDMFNSTKESEPQEMTPYQAEMVKLAQDRDVAEREAAEREAAQNAQFNASTRIPSWDMQGGVGNKTRTGGEIAAKVANEMDLPMDDERVIAEVNRRMQRYLELAEEAQPEPQTPVRDTIGAVTGEAIKWSPPGMLYRGGRQAVDKISNWLNQ
jgi:hypothetical protein